MKSRVYSILLSVAVCACSAAPPSGTPVPWTKESVVGLQMELVDPTRVEQYFFGDGTVGITVGVKGGPYTGPAMEWRIIEGRLVICFFRHPGIEEPKAESGFTLLYRDTSTIVLKDSSGKVKTFRVLRNP